MRSLTWRIASLSLAALLQSLLLFGYALAQTSNLAERARESIVYIFFDIIDPQTGGKARVQGTGFIVSPSGHVLTAAHLFRSWHQQTDASKVANLIQATRYDKPGYTRESPLILDPISLGDGDAEDVALLKLPHIGGKYETAPICLEASDRVQIGDSLMAYGFPADQNFQPIPGIFGTQSARGGRWAATSAFIEGMSGGPIYNANGIVVGLIKGGLTNTDAVRWITPIRYASPRLTMAGAPEKCALAAAVPNAQASDVEDVLWTFLQENYSPQSAASFLKRFPNSRYKAELEKRMASADEAGSAAAVEQGGAEPDQYWTFQTAEARQISVCWENTDSRFVTEREWVRTAIKESWELFSSIRFVGWSKCQADQNAVRIATSDTYPHVKAVGPKVVGIQDGVVLNFEFGKWTSTCKTRRESCIRSIAVHEFGHVLGFPHENDRPDAPLACRRLRPAIGVRFTGKLITPYDEDSVMNYCNPVFANNGVLSSLDKEKLRIIYGRPDPL